MAVRRRRTTDPETGQTQQLETAEPSSEAEGSEPDNEGVRSNSEIEAECAKEYGRIVSNVVASNLVVFRAPEAAEIKRYKDDAPSYPSSSVLKQLCISCVVHPDPKVLRTVIGPKVPGIYNAASSALLEMAGDDVELTDSPLALDESDRDQVEELQKQHGDVRFGYAPDGELVVIRGASEVEWSNFQDSKESRYDRLLQLASALIVHTSIPKEELLAKYPSIVGPCCDATVELIGAAIEFRAKKG